MKEEKNLDSRPTFKAGEGEGKDDQADIAPNAEHKSSWQNM